MNYVFFDVECANCLNGEGKICSVGYVVTDESFQVLKKKDILMDPNAPFLLGNVKTGEGIKLAYPLFRFRQARTFPYYYKELQALLTNENNLCFGFAVCQDVSYISYSCKRYSLPLIDFKFFDIQKMERELNHKKNVSSLDGLVEEFHVTSYTYHRSDDDALMTMEVFKALLENNHLSVKEVTETYESSFNDTETLVADIEKRKKAKAIKRLHQDKIKALFATNSTTVDINLCTSFFYKKNFFFDNALLDKEMDYLLKNRDTIIRKGGMLTRNPAKADVVIVTYPEKRLHQLNVNESAVYVDFKTFKSEMTKKGK